MIVVSHQHRNLRFSRKETFRAVRLVTAVERLSSASISVVFTDDHFTKRMNKRFLRHDAVTDVIAFPLTNGRPVEGEIYVNLDQARRQAKFYGVSYSEEVRRLIVHGTLHLAGYTDNSQKLKAKMRKREDSYLQRLK